MVHTDAVLSGVDLGGRHDRSSGHPGIIPSEAGVVFGAEKADLRLPRDPQWPLQDGFMHAVAVCKTFKNDLSVPVAPKGSLTLWSVVAVPANETSERQKNIRPTMVGFLESHRICPEAFLAAMGLPTTLVLRRVLPASIRPNIRRGSTQARARSLRDLRSGTHYGYPVAPETPRFGGLDLELSRTPV